MKVCCVTGHRDLPDSKIEFVRQQLGVEVRAAVADGYTYFISGFAAGVDLLFAEVVLSLQAHNPAIQLAAYLPSRSRMHTRDVKFHDFFSRCSFVWVVCEQYRRGCELERNRKMVDQSGRIIAVYDGRPKGGTLFTINYAKKMKRELHIIRI